MSESSRFRISRDIHWLSRLPSLSTGDFFLWKTTRICEETTDYGMFRDRNS